MPTNTLKVNLHVLNALVALNRRTEANFGVNLSVQNTKHQSPRSAVGRPSGSIFLYQRPDKVSGEAF